MWPLEKVIFAKMFQILLGYQKSAQMQKYAESSNGLNFGCNHTQLKFQPGTVEKN